MDGTYSHSSVSLPLRMSIDIFPRFIQTRDLLRPLVIESGKEFNSKFGVYRHTDLIGVPYGSKIGSRNGKGFIHVLRPTPELWTLALPHRTQILYLADIAFVVSWLNIKPGSRVIEAGTSLSRADVHSSVCALYDRGHCQNQLPRPYRSLAFLALKQNGHAYRPLSDCVLSLLLSGRCSQTRSASRVLERRL